MGMPKRGEISVFNIVCILAMVLVHAVSGIENAFTGEGAKTASLLSLNIFDFIFEGYIFLSGLRLFLNRYDKMTADTFYVNRIVLVMLPYIVASAIYYAFYALIGERTASTEDFLLFFIKGEMFDRAYFILVLAQFYLLMPLISVILKKANHKVSAVVFFVISLVFALIQIRIPVMNRLFMQYIIFFAGGTLCAIYYKEFKTFVREKKIFTVLLFILSLVFYLMAGFLKLELVVPFARIIYSAGAILMLFMISTAISDKYYIKNFVLRQVDKSAYFIFLMHGIIIYTVGIALVDKIGLGHTPQMYLIKALSVLIVTVVVSIIWRYIRNIFLLKRYS